MKPTRFTGERRSQRHASQWLYIYETDAGWFSLAEIAQLIGRSITGLRERISNKGLTHEETLISKGKVDMFAAVERGRRNSGLSAFSSKSRDYNLNKISVGSWERAHY